MSITTGLLTVKFLKDTQLAKVLFRKQIFMQMFHFCYRRNQCQWCKLV